MPQESSNEKPLIGISRCILGEKVRYDGEIKHYPELLDFIHTHFRIVSVCPEVEIGLSVPRPPVQLTGQPGAIEMTGRDDPSINITSAMQDFCVERPPQLNSIHGYIFKSRSPSCGISDIPVFNSLGKAIASSRGLFASAMLQHYPGLPITDERQLDTIQKLETFLQQVTHYQQHR